MTTTFEIDERRTFEIFIDYAKANDYDFKLVPIIHLTTSETYTLYEINQILNN